MLTTFHDRLQSGNQGVEAPEPEPAAPHQTFTSVGSLPDVAATTSLRAPTASELGYSTQPLDPDGIMESDVPDSPSAFARFAVERGLTHDGLRSIARVLDVGVDCSRSRNLENVALRLCSSATQAGVIKDLPALVVRELTSGSVSSTDALLHPQDAATLDEVPASMLPLRAWFAERLSEEELELGATFAGLGLDARRDGSTELRVQHLILQAQRSHGGLDRVRSALLDVYNMKVREAAPPSSPSPSLDGSTVALTCALFDACTLDTLKAIAIRAGYRPEMIGSTDRRLLFANQLVSHAEQQGMLDHLRSAAAEVLSR